MWDEEDHVRAWKALVLWVGQEGIFLSAEKTVMLRKWGKWTLDKSWKGSKNSVWKRVISHSVIFSQNGCILITFLSQTMLLCWCSKTIKAKLKNYSNMFSEQSNSWSGSQVLRNSEDREISCPKAVRFYRVQAISNYVSTTHWVCAWVW